MAIITPATAAKEQATSTGGNTFVVTGAVDGGCEFLDSLTTTVGGAPDGYTTMWRVEWPDSSSNTTWEVMIGTWTTSTSTLTRVETVITSAGNTTSLAFNGTVVAFGCLSHKAVLGGDWIAPTLLNSWVNFAGGYATAGYKKIGNTIHSKGMVGSGSSVTAVIYTLPAGYRPGAHRMIPARSSAGAAQIEILTSGNVAVTSGGSTYWSSIEFSFELD